MATYPGGEPFAARVKRVEDRGDELQTKISELRYAMDSLEQELRRLQRSVEQNTNALKKLRTRGG